MKTLGTAIALALLSRAAALLATPSFAVKALAGSGLLAAPGSKAVNPEEPSRSAFWESDGMRRGADWTETVPGAPDESVFVLHRTR